MKPTGNPNFSLPQRGMALVVALILLLVMTMVAVVATRTTTVDLKMTTNTTLARRAFQGSEGSRTSLGPSLEDHVFYRGWPSTITGGTAPATANFDIPTEVEVMNGASNWFMGTNGRLADLGPPTSSRTHDVEFELDVDGDSFPDNEDMFADIWVTRVASMLIPGAGAAQGSGYLGPGVGAAGAGANVFFDVRSEGQAAGNVEMVTGADYRVLVQNCAALRITRTRSCGISRNF